MAKKFNWKLASTIALPLVGGTVIGVMANKNTGEKYEHLETPKLSPPSWVFPVAWTALYTMMGVAKYEFDQKNKSKQAQKMGDIFYFTQLGLNFLWSPLFFKEDKRGLALIDATLLWLGVNSTTCAYRQHSKTATSLMLPYIGWSTYAMYLNYGTWKLNQSDKV